jgi:hypothetical protein
LIDCRERLYRRSERLTAKKEDHFRGLYIGIDEMDENIEAECDEEIARISSQAVLHRPNQANKMSHEKGNGSGGDNNGHPGGRLLDPPRPMSWDGELSDNDAIVSSIIF